MTLQSAFFIFLGVILFHGIAIFALKMAVSSHFKSTSWLNKFGHVVESLHLPHAFKDFDLVEEGSPEDYRLAYNSVLKETLWMTSLQAVSNLLLLVPLLVTGDIKVESDINSHEFFFSLQSEGETLCSCPQHWDVCRGG